MEPTAELKQAVREYREGKAEAFTLLYEKSSRYLYTCIRTVMGDNDNAQDVICDIMQDTYLEISKNIGQLDREERFLSWASTIANRKCYAWLKKNKKYVLLHEEDDTFDTLAEEEDLIPEAILQDREKQRLVREMIDTRLTEMQKMCIIAFYYNEQKQAEIAQELGIPENTVKTNLSRAKAKIRNSVLDLEEKQGTRLYSVAPFLLLLFQEEVLACTVPSSITAAVNSSVLGAGKTGIRHLLTKVAEASVKAKVAAAAVGAGVIIAAGTMAYVAMQDGADAREEAFQENLSQDILTEGSALQDPEAEGVTKEPDDPQVQHSQTEEISGSGEPVTLSEKEQKDLQTLAGLLTLDSYFFGGDMYGGHYPVEDVAVNMNLIDMIGAMGMSDNSPYVEYLPPAKTDEASFTRVCRAADVQSYLKNVFGVENADISAFCQGDRVVFQMVGDPVQEEARIDNAVSMPDGAYRITGTFFLWHMEDILEVAYPYELTVIKKEESPFGFQVRSMEFGEAVTEAYGQAGEDGQSQPSSGDGALEDILLNPEGNPAYYPQEVEYGMLYFAQIDIDLDGEEEILLGTTDYLRPDGKPNWMNIFNILKYDRSTGEVWDFDGDRVYKPLDADSWHYYDTGILMTMAEISYVHTYFWNLLTGECIEADLWYPDDPERSFESEGHSRIYNADGTYITGEEGDRAYQALKSGNEIPIVWHEASPENVEAILTGGNMEPAYIPTPYGRYHANRGAELEFFEDHTVYVSEGNSGHRYAFTIDGDGNMVIDPQGEAVEGTYDAQADEIWVDTLRFRK